MLTLTPTPEQQPTQNPSHLGRRVVRRQRRRRRRRFYRFRIDRLSYNKIGRKGFRFESRFGCSESLGPLVTHSSSSTSFLRLVSCYRALKSDQVITTLLESRLTHIVF